ncbi:TolB family protein [Ruania alba]|uniref:WD40-like Beta Propeller Repeat n=1 Tax=Ruania alba TaxID=648782 RepID=A0A1H5KQJ9_9MICO|nr:PD40 domain-containing protein [Ruania alba]SEE67106.1 WD40-like Beta Propeller Repeat [Ruania alba]
MPRTLAPGQRARIHTIDVTTGTTHLVHESTEVLYEAPNWTLDGTALIVNGDGTLFRLPVDSSGDPEPIEIPGIPPLNNDHVLDPDGAHVFVSAEDGHIYRAPLTGGEADRITTQDGLLHFLHGVSPDGGTLAYVGVVTDPGGAWHAPNLFTIPATGGASVQLTEDEFPDDGAEFSPDGRWIYVNTERPLAGPPRAAGHAQLARMHPDGSGAEQLTHDKRVNWFPHPSPDGARLAYVSFPPGTVGHPADHDVIIRMCGPRGEDVTDLVNVFGGQGTMNVPSWSPDSTRIAYVDYPVGT